MKYKFIETNIDDLQFDHLNPRVPRRLEEQDEKDIIEWMLSDATLFDLIASIGTYDFYPAELLLVMESPQQVKYCDCGNRRLASCKSLKDFELVNVKNKRINKRVGETKMEYTPQVIPACVFDKREDILIELDYTPGPQWSRVGSKGFAH